MHALWKYLKIKEKHNASFKHTYSNLNNTTIFVVRILNTKENLPNNQQYWFGKSKPCKNCQKNLYKYNIHKIKYTDIIDGENVICEMVKNK